MTKAGEAEHTADIFSEQVKGNMEKKLALMNLEDIVQNEDAIANEFCDEQNLKQKNEMGEKKNIVLK